MMMMMMIMVMIMMMMIMMLMMPMMAMMLMMAMMTMVVMMMVIAMMEMMTMMLTPYRCGQLGNDHYYLDDGDDDLDNSSYGADRHLVDNQIILNLFWFYNDGATVLINQSL